MDTADKDYLNARLQALSEQVRANQVATDARLDQFNQTLAFGLKSTLNEYSLKQAQIEASLQKFGSEITKSRSEIIKWVAGISIASAAFTISATVAVVTQYGPRNSGPIIVYAQPAPPATPLKTKP